MKTVIEIIDRSGRRAPPFHSRYSSRLFHSIASTTAGPEIAFAKRMPDGSSSNGDSKSRLTSISTQAFFSPATGPIIAGFIISGSAPQRILLRAAGPALAELGLKNWLAYPRIQLFDSSGVSLGENNEWETEAVNIPSGTVFPSFFPFRARSRDAAIVATLAPGAYTAHVSSHSASGSGVSVVEAYEMRDQDEPFHDRRLVNLSTLAQVSVGEQALVARFTVVGTPRRRVLIRGVGPGLANYGVSNSLADPRIELYSSSRLIAANDRWDIANRSEITALSANCGAFPLHNGSRDAALVITLDPDSYTVVLKSAGGSIGRGLIEVYETFE